MNKLKKQSIVVELVKKAEFIQSNTDHKKCPEPKLPEYAFIGRSNVGKSSLINMLTKYGKLAKTSGRPGKTQLINHFLINENWYLVDLPGYGFAKTPKNVREKWEIMISNYISQRENLMCVCVLIDIRHEPQKNDLIFMENLADKQIPFVIVFTKSDKLGKNKILDNVDNYKAKMLEKWHEFPQYFITSAEHGTGREELLTFIMDTNKLFT